MLENSSVELKTFVLLEFTKRLIISKNPMEFLIREKRELPKIKKENNNLKVISNFLDNEKFEEKLKNEIPKKEIQRSRPPGGARQIFAQRSIQNAPILRVPETRLPPQFAYLRPYATTEVELDFEKLNPLLTDQAVNAIESNGPDQAVIVKGSMGIKPTNVILSKEEIDQIIQTFSKKSKIPVKEGVVKIVLGRYVLSAIISEEFGSRFIITKLPQTHNSGMPRR